MAWGLHHPARVQTQNWLRRAQRRGEAYRRPPVWRAVVRPARYFFVWRTCLQQFSRTQPSFALARRRGFFSYAPASGFSQTKPPFPLAKDVTFASCAPASGLRAIFPDKASVPARDCSRKRSSFVSAGVGEAADDGNEGIEVDVFGDVHVESRVDGGLDIAAGRVAGEGNGDDAVA
jgi:hypothetical protein